MRIFEQWAVRGPCLYVVNISQIKQSTREKRWVRPSIYFKMSTKDFVEFKLKINFIDIKIDVTQKTHINNNK